jgi:diguanylate cyclase (GGDEF)-like protein
VRSPRAFTQRNGRTNGGRALVEDSVREFDEFESMEDLQSNYNSMCVSLSLTALTLWAGIGWRRVRLHLWTMALIWQSVGWALMSAGTQWRFGRAFQAAGVLSLVVGSSTMLVTACHYVGRKYGRVWVAGPALLTAGLLFIFSEIRDKRLIVDTVMGSQFCWLSLILLPRRRDERSMRWRWLAFGVCVTLGAWCASRAVIAFYEPAAAVVTGAPRWITSAGAVFEMIWPAIFSVCFLLAHRDEAESALRDLAMLDGLTGLLNRRALMECAATKLATVRRQGQRLAILMIDVDHFKSINDLRGHQVGDEVLKQFAEALRGCVRQEDIVGRYGGEEFCILLSVTDLEDARSMDARLRARLDRVCRERFGFDVSFSAGAVEVGDARHVDFEALLQLADRALYEAKNAGRGRLIVQIADQSGAQSATSNVIASF